MPEFVKEAQKFFDLDVCINRLAWLAGEDDGYPSETLEEMLDTHSSEELLDLLIKMGLEEKFKSHPEFKKIDIGGFLEVALDLEALGFLAELRIPQRFNFTESGYSSGNGTSYVPLIYSQTLEGLVSQAEALSDKFKEHDRETEAARKAAKKEA